MARYTRLVAILFALLVAGCADREVDDRAKLQAGDGHQNGSSGPTLADAPVRLPGTRTAFEPNIAILPDGTVFVVAIGTPDSTPASVDTNVWLWKSTDHGKTWKTLEAPNGGGAASYSTYDADLVASPDGWLYVADWWIDHDDEGARVDQVLILASPDGGKTWQKTPAPLPPGTVIDREYLVAGKDGSVGLFYHRHIDGPNSIEAVFSRDHGVTWTKPVVVVRPQSDRFPIIAHPLVLDDGTFVLPYGHNHHEGLHLGKRTDIRVASSEDGGTTWNHQQFGFMARGPGHLWPMQAATDGKAITLVWARDDGPTMSVWSTRLPALGAQFGSIQQVTHGGQHLMPWAAAYGDDVIASWYDADVYGDSTSAPSDTAWRIGAARITSNTVSLLAPTPEPVHTGTLCASPTCTGHTRLGDYQSVAVDPDGIAYFAYAGTVGDDVRVFVRAMAL